MTRLDVSCLSVLRFWLRLLISLRDRFKNRKLLWFCCNYVGEFCMFTVSVESEVSVGVMVSFVDMKFVWLIWQLGAAKFCCRATVNGEFSLLQLKHSCNTWTLCNELVNSWPQPSWMDNERESGGEGGESNSQEKIIRLRLKHQVSWPWTLKTNSV